MKRRNFNRLLQDRGEINLSTRSESSSPKKYIRKEKHKNKPSYC